MEPIYFLMAGRSGAPLHLSCPAGHSTMAGAGVAILRAFFNTLGGRDFLGVHFLSDGDLGILLGEELAISILQDHVNTVAEDITFKFRWFDGSLVVIERDISL